MDNADDRPDFNYNDGSSSFDREPLWKMNRPVDEPLTKRERLAARNYAALLSSGGNVEPELEAYARIAVKGADALLTELNES